MSGTARGNRVERQQAGDRRDDGDDDGEPRPVDEKRGEHRLSSDSSAFAAGLACTANPGRTPWSPSTITCSPPFKPSLITPFGPLSPPGLTRCSVSHLLVRAACRGACFRAQSTSPPSAACARARSPRSRRSTSMSAGACGDHPSRARADRNVRFQSAAEMQTALEASAAQLGLDFFRGRARALAERLSGVKPASWSRQARLRATRAPACSMRSMPSSRSAA